ncbi:MAG: sigma-70 family RNA polymerase sigma factor [Lachnospiraceae bacterium]|nr:sigma-70 family RNA polymerase sigma factor [Lachnospiraceae bacterium]
MDKTNLSELFTRVQRRDKDAFTQLYHDLKQPVFTIIYRIVQNQTIAEDLTQDLFVKLFTAPPDSTVKNPRAWIFQMAHNLAIDSLRKTQPANIDDITLASEERMNAIIIKTDLERAIATLSSPERVILSLRANGGLGFSDIASITGQSLSSVYRSYRKTLKALQTLLNGGTL